MEGEIGAPIIDEDQFKTFRIGLHHPFQPIVKNGDVLLFIMEGTTIEYLGMSVQIISRIEGVTQIIVTTFRPVNSVPKRGRH